jgi:CO dehydrogenase maturation factor
MGIKLAISGKGGVGKSTLAGTLARLFAADGRPVLAIDADPDANLASALGMPENLRKSIHTIAQERSLVEERTGAKVCEFGQMFSLNPDVSGIAERYGVDYAGVSLLVLGAIPRAGAGCACAEGTLLKSLVRDLVMNRDDVVILDMEAGIEHLGRGSAMGVDLMLVVVEPGQRSIDTARRVQEMARDLGIGRFAVVMNKATNLEPDTEWVKRELGDAALIGVIPFDARIADADRTQSSLADLGHADLLRPFIDIKQYIEER